MQYFSFIGYSINLYHFNYYILRFLIGISRGDIFCSEVGFDNLGVIEYLIGRALDYLFTEIQHAQFMANAHHGFHIVFNYNNGYALVANFPDFTNHILFFGGVHAGNRFIEEQHFGLGSQADSYSEQSLVAMREVQGQFILEVGKSHKLEDFLT